MPFVLQLKDGDPVALSVMVCPEQIFGAGAEIAMDCVAQVCFRLILST